MSSPGRIRTIYVKELIDILRDRRTLIAMIVVPIVLYPLLMLGSVQAVSYQADSLLEEKIIVGVIDEAQGRELVKLFKREALALREQRDQLGPDSEEAGVLPRPLSEEAAAEVLPRGSLADLEQDIRDRLIHVGVVFPNGPVVDSVAHQNAVRILADLEEVRSHNAERRLDALFDRIGEHIGRARLTREGLPAVFVDPFEVATVDLSSPPSILGQILPLILILMTITGAIYPAIDLTAGERERGTLETLMVCPVPVIDLIVGKFLVVTTVAIMGATLNLASVSATVYFGGFDKVIADSDSAVPYGKMGLILCCLIPFAVLMSAIMIAVCSYARTFKEAQNYVTPVILAVLIPGGLAALPATSLDGIMLVMPVGNMVLLSRDLLLGAPVPLWQIAMVLLSTTLYAGAAVAVAASVFGKESVVFADAGSLKTALTRRLIKPTPRPSVAMTLLVVALLFPMWFFIQSKLSPELGQDVAPLLRATAWLMPLLFVLLPAGLLFYWKVDVAQTFGLRMPAGKYLLAAVLIGASAWVPAREISVLQHGLLGASARIDQGTEMLAKTLGALPAVEVFLLIALIPAVCEELLFRGFLLRGLGSSARKWTAIIASAAVFGVFHFLLFRWAVTAALGVVLGYLCWQSRSVLPAMIVHCLHNTIGVIGVIWPQWPQRLGIDDDTGWSHLPAHILIIGGAVFLLGLLIVARPRATKSESALPAIVDAT